MNATAAKLRQLFFQIENLIEQLEYEYTDEMAERAAELTYEIRRLKVQLWLNYANKTNPFMKEVKHAAEG